MEDDTVMTRRQRQRRAYKPGKAREEGGFERAEEEGGWGLESAGWHPAKRLK